MAPDASAGLPNGGPSVTSGQETLERLFSYARPYRSRLAWAVAGMVVYAAGSAGLAYLIKPIIDNVLLKPGAAVGRLRRGRSSASTS